MNLKMNSKTGYGMLYDESESPYRIYKRKYRIPFAKFSRGTVFLPLSAFVFCVLYSVLFNFESATFTHCNVYNFLPSISAAIGNYSPQREVWQVAIYLHFLPRLCIALVYYQYNKDILIPQTLVIRVLVCILNVTENVALLTLSHWTSSDNYTVHKVSFVTFILMSQLYMLLTWALHDKCRKTTGQVSSRSLRWKKRLVVANIVCIVAATYCFMRHNSYCEPYVYTAFAFFEYIVVLTNMGFHMTSYFDLRDKDLVVYSGGITYKSRYSVI